MNGTAEQTKWINQTDHFIEVLQHLSQGILLIQENHAIYMNPSLEKMSGYTLHELQELEVDEALDLIFQEDRPQIKDRLEQRLQGNETNHQYQIRMICKDGRVHWVKLESTLIQVNHKPVIMTVWTDIDRQVKLDEELKKSEEQFQSIFNHSQDGIFLCDEEGKIIQWNAGMEKISSLPVDEVIGKPLWDIQYQLIPEYKKSPEVYENLKNEILKVTRTGKTDWVNTFFEEEIVNSQGIQFFMQTQPFVVKTQLGYLLGTINRDITEMVKTRKQLEEFNSELEQRVIQRTVQLEKLNQELESEIAEREEAQAALHHSRQVLSSILDHIPQRIFWKDRDLVYMGCNRAFADDWNLPDKEMIIGKNDYDLSPIEFAEKYRADDRHVLETNAPKLNYEEMQQKPDGSLLWLRTSKIPIHDVNHNISGVLTTYEDISLLKKNEAQQIALYKIAQAAQNTENLEELFRSIHEILIELMAVNNFYIALYDRKNDLIHFPYFYDQNELQPAPRKFGRGLTEYVIRTGKSFLGNAEKINLLYEEGEIDLIGAESLDWMGVPLKVNHETFGVMVTQTYTDRLRFSNVDLEMFDFVSAQIAMAIHRKRVEEEIEQQHAFLHKIIDSNPNIIIVMDREKRITLANQATAGLLGFPVIEDMIGRQIEDFNSFFEQADNSRKDDEDIFLKKKDRVISIDKFTGTSGKTHYFQTVKTPICDEYGEVQQILIVASDITERRQREMELETVSKTSAALREATNRKEMLPIILKELTGSINASGTMIAEIDPVTKEICVSLAWGAVAQYTGKIIHPNKGITPRVIATKEVYVNNISIKNDPSYYNEYLDEDFTAVCVPIAVQDVAFGALWAYGKKPFDSSEIRLIQAIANMAANAFHRSASNEQMKQRLKQLNALHQIDLAISSSHDIRSSLEVLLEQVKSELNVDAADVLVISPNAKSFHFAAGLGFKTHFIEHTHIKVGEGIAGKAGLEKRIISITELKKEEGFSRSALLAEEDFISFHAVPLIAKGEVKGILEVFSRSQRYFSREWLDFLEMLAGQAALAVDNAILFDDLQKSNQELTLAYDATIEGWSHALEIRDRETQGHAERVVDLTLQIAKRMNLAPDEMVHIRRGALLHDIGKMGIPDHILSKAGPLTDHEWEIMREHPFLAFKMLSQINFLRPALDIPFYHHEKWDGSGYPFGLQGEQIPSSFANLTI